MWELVERRKDRHWRSFDTEQYTIVNGRTKKLCRAVFQKGQNYKNLSTGNWEDFNGRWEYDDTTDPQGNRFGWKVKKSDAQLRIFTQNPNKKWMRIGFAPGVFVQYSLPNVEPSYSENSAIFADGWPDADMRLTASPEGVKNDIILKAPGHPASFSFPVTLTGCTAKAEGNTLVYYRDGDIIAHVPAPWMEDANGERGEVVLSYDGQAVTYTPDADWLKTTAYPVTVDPTTTLQPDPTAGKDTPLYGTTTYDWSAAVWIHGGKSSTGTVARALIEFDLSTIPAGSTINSAILSLEIDPSYCNGVENTYEPIYLHKILESWLENANGVNQPAHDLVATASCSVLYTFASPSWSDWDITTITQEWVSGTTPNYGLKILGDESRNSTRRGFHSSDFSTATQRPKFTIDFTEGSTGTDIVKVVTDAMGISETMLKTRGRLRVFTHLLSVTDIAAKARDRLKIVSNSIGLTDVTSSGRGRLKVISDTLGLTEAFIRARGRLKMVSDTIGLFESIVKQLIRRIVKYAPDYTWREIPERYSAKELPERYKATEIPSRYTWKEL